LILAAEHGRVKFFGGDLVGMVVAEFLGADAVVVPVNCNDALDRGPLKDVLEPKTRIGSPYVIAGMELARKKGRKAICGWEANGGFFLGSDITVAGRVLKALPTRDAVLPILGVLCSMRKKKLSMTGLFDQLPKRYSRSALLRNISNAKGNQIVRRFTPASAAIRQIVFGGQQPVFLDAERRALPAAAAQVHEAEKIRSSLVEFFSPALGFGDIARLDYTDGVRIYFGNDVVTHIRPSGNADELRIYALADTQTRANEIAALGIAEPDGLLRRLERAT
jgi:phosphomannomutase